MNPERRTHLTPSELLRVLVAHRRLVIVPAVMGFVLAAAYACMIPRDWEARQALIVRAEATGLSDERLGKFADLSEMKTLQETILELARSQGVVEATLKRVAGGKRRSSHQWPKAKDIDELRRHLKITPPGGAEFGKTEVFYISVLDPSRERAKSLVTALCDELATRLQQLRDERAGSLIAEMENTVALSQIDLDREIEKLAAIESQVGADLTELRNLISGVGGTSEVAQQLRQIEAERRSNRMEWRASEQLISLLKNAQGDAEELAALPNRLLETQPALRSLKQALVNTQVNTASVLASKTLEHPSAKAALRAEKQVRRHLQAEFAAAIKGLEFDVAHRQDRDVELQTQWETGHERLRKLAAIRADYANVVASVSDHTTLLEAARRSLADARAHRAGAQHASIVSRIDGVDTGTDPVGLGRTTIAGTGGVAGLLFGLGVVFLIGSPVPVISNGSAPPAGDQSPVSVTPSAQPATRRQAVFAAAATSAPGVNDSESAVAGLFGLFRSMPLSEAVRKVEGRLASYCP